MAKIIYSGLVSDVSGSIGNATFRKQSGQPIIQTRPGTKRIQSNALAHHHNILAQANAEWSSLDSPARKFWKLAAEFETTRGNPHTQQTRSARLFFIGWRMKCLHAGASCAYTVQPPLPVFTAAYFRMTLFSPGLSVTWYNYPAGGVPPYPRCAAWISWPAGGCRRPGRRWFKFWPSPGFENKAYGVDLDTLLYGVMGYPPELTAETSGFYPWKIAPRVRAHGVYASGRVGVMAERDVAPPPAGYYFKFPPDPPVFGGFAA